MPAGQKTSPSAFDTRATLPCPQETRAKDGFRHPSRSLSTIHYHKIFHIIGHGRSLQLFGRLNDLCYCYYTSNLPTPFPQHLGHATYRRTTILHLLPNSPPNLLNPNINLPNLRLPSHSSAFPLSHTYPTTPLHGQQDLPGAQLFPSTPRHFSAPNSDPCSILLQLCPCAEFEVVRVCDVEVQSGEVVDGLKTSGASEEGEVEDWKWGEEGEDGGRARAGGNETRQRLRWLWEFRAAWKCESGDGDVERCKEVGEGLCGMEDLFQKRLDCWRG